MNKKHFGRGRSPKPRGELCAHFKHGGSNRDKQGRQDHFYSSWVNMRQRCTNKNRPDFSYYGGRGISVCKQWSDFAQFSKDMHESYIAHKKENTTTTLDRIDTNKNYSPENCRWATRKVQSCNRNFNRPVVFSGESKLIGEWIKSIPITATWKQLHKRIFRLGWTPERAFTTPIKKSL